MLVLTRKRDETINIGSNIVIRVIRTAKGSVKLGIEAPDSVRIKRGEIATVQGVETEESVEQSFEIELEESVYDMMGEGMYAAMLVQS